MKNLVFIISVIMFSCSSPESSDKKGAAILSSFESGKIYKDVKCINDTAVGYSLYLPEKYSSTDEAFPLLVFFDAHARGLLPVNKYFVLAERYGFVLVGSNNSENGQAPAESDRIVRMTIEDVKQKLRVDEKRVSVSGFSGGARVAAGIALNSLEEVNGVIGCAAGFPRIKGKYNPGFAYLGMVGDKDFNYLEMKSLNTGLEHTPIKHYLIVYNGKHDWAPAGVMDESFEFLLFNDMKNGRSKKDTGLINRFLSHTDSMIKIAKAENDLLKLSDTYNRVVVFLNGLAELGRYKDDLENLKKDPGYQKQAAKESEGLAYEVKRQKELIAAVPKDLNWWQVEIGKMQNDTLNSVNARLLSFLSIVFYMYSDGTLKQHQPEDSKKYLELYQRVDPGNPDVYFLKADYFMLKSDPQAALRQLQKAADLGYADTGKLKGNPAFLSLHDNAEFIKIEEKVKSNHLSE